MALDLDEKWQLYLQKPWFRNLIILVLSVGFLFFALSLREVFAPVFIALALAYLFDPVIDKFEEWKMSRTWGIILLLAIMAITIAGILLYVVPKLISQIQDLSEKLPIYWSQLETKLMPELQSFINEHPEEIEEAKISAVAWLKTHAVQVLQSIGSGIVTSLSSVGGFLSNMLGLIIVPVLAFYLLRDFDILKDRVVDILPKGKRDYVVNLFTELDEAMGNFIQGQLLVAIILSIIYSIGLTIAGCPGSLLIGCLAGFANLVPYLGIVVGFVPAVLLTYLSGNPTWQIIVSALTFLVGQLMEGMVITPKVVGESVGLHPAMVLIALMAGGSYFGIVGMILALPASAVLLVLIKRIYNGYKHSVLYHDNQDDTKVTT